MGGAGFNSPLICAIFTQAYEPVEEGSYIKMIDMVSGHGGQIQVSVNDYLLPFSPFSRLGQKVLYAPHFWFHCFVYCGKLSWSSLITKC